MQNNASITVHGTMVIRTPSRLVYSEELGFEVVVFPFKAVLILLIPGPGEVTMSSTQRKKCGGGVYVLV